MKQIISTAKVARMTDVFPQAVRAGGFVFISGMPGIDPVSGKIQNTDFKDQLRQSFLNIQTLLEDTGGSLTDIVKTTIFMVTGNDFNIVNEVYREFFPDQAPARSTPQVMPFPGGILVSVECIAIDGSSAK